MAVLSARAQSAGRRARTGREPPPATPRAARPVTVGTSVSFLFIVGLVPVHQRPGLRLGVPRRPTEAGTDETKTHPHCGCQIKLKFAMLVAS